MIYEVPIARKMPVEASVAGLWANRATIFSYGLERRKAQNRNFSVVVEVIDDRKVLTLQSQERAVTLNDLLPQGVSIERSQHSNYFDEPHRKIWYITEFEKTGSILGLLHEIRHAQIAPPITDIPQQLTNNEALEYFKPLFLRIKKGDFTSADEQKEVYERIIYISQMYRGTTWDYAYKETIGEKVPFSFLQAAFAYEALEEIECWRYAVEEAKYLESLGFNVLSEFKSEEEMQQYIDSCLATYERGRYRELKRRSSLGDMYYPIYL